MKNPPHLILSLLPFLTVIITLNVLNWDIVIALLSGILLIIILSVKKLKGIIPAGDSAIAMINTSAAIGFGTVVRAVPRFQKLSDYISSIDANPLISLAIATNVLAGATGSASGGLNALPHNRTVLTILIVTGMTHKESYKDIAVIAIDFPLLSLIPAILLASVGIY